MKLTQLKEAAYQHEPCFVKVFWTTDRYEKYEQENVGPFHTKAAARKFVKAVKELNSRAGTDDYGEDIIARASVAKLDDMTDPEEWIQAFKEDYI